MSNELKTPEPKKRLNLDLPASKLARVHELAKTRGSTASDLVRAALGLLEKVESEVTEGKKLAVIDGNGNLVKEFILPY